MNTFGYCRCSTAEQNEARQIIAMNELQIPKERIFLDKQSGKDFDRPAYQALVGLLRPGDLLYILSLDRLGRDYFEIQDQWRMLTKERGVDIVILDMPLLDTRRDKDLIGTLISDIVLQLLAYICQNLCTQNKNAQDLEESA